MPTTISRTIGSGGYYATVADWNADAPANLVTADQVWEGRLLNQVHTASTTVATIAGSMSDATRFKRLTCDTGASFRDHASKLTNALLPNSANGALVTQTGTNSSNCTLVVTEPYAEIIGLQISSTNGGNSDGTDSPPTLFVGNSTIKVRWCLVDSYSSYSVALLGGCVPKFCTFIKRRHSGVIIRPTTDSLDIGLDNCALLVPSNVDLGGGTYTLPSAILRNYNVTTLRNCASFGASGLTGSGVGTITSTNCVGDFVATGWTQVAFDTTTGAGFQNTTNDFRVKSSSAMVGAGATYAGIPTEDIIGQTVAATPSAGAWEASTGGGGTPVAFTGTVPTINATVGTAGSVDLASYFSGSLTPFTYSTFAGTLPTGFSRSGAIISWTTGTTAATTTGIQVRATDTGTNVATTNAFSIVVAAAPSPPTINTHPSNQTVTTPTAATFTVSASGTGLSYQWQRNPGGVGSFANISGATSASYTTGATAVTGGSHNNGDTYRAVVTNSGGSVNSNAATLTANAPSSTGTLTLTTPLTNNTGLISGRWVSQTGITLTVISESTKASVLVVTGRATDASGVLTAAITDAAITTGQTYRVLPSFSGNAGLSQVLTAT
jgi:hypothetical protein